MKQTVAELFSEEVGRAYVPLMWGGREEDPAEVAWRIWCTMGLIKEHAQAGGGCPDALWTVLAGNGLEFVPAPDTLPAVEELALQETEVRDGKRCGRTHVHLQLTPEGPESLPIASLHAMAGEIQTTVANSVNFSFQPNFPLGTIDQATELFRGLVRIWQPDAGILSTKETIREVTDLYDTYAGYLTWISSAPFGTPPDLASASAESFGEGTLLTARDWSVPGVKNMHTELLGAGAPALTAFPRDRQMVPTFRAKHTF
ncbi:hypothetical protein QNO00_05095 [Arthrobacter sp. zg-Y1219]|uniref:hypothetical protein n=1 Tax=Arthrobacter sp. zg-Y1219 TaxID=3049067 RepID=UPI0024C34797|nr:hypothetical protein [Arthrobacter sp. zg-Y1219]MDK1359641.1 hypothetical protein [Arthrobacter sp. zg-Y1219]